MFMSGLCRLYVRPARQNFPQRHSRVVFGVVVPGIACRFTITRELVVIVNDCAVHRAAAEL